MRTNYILAIAVLLLVSVKSYAQIDVNFPMIKQPDSTEITNSNKPVIKTSLNGVITASGFYQNGIFGLGDGAHNVGKCRAGQR